MSTIVVLVHGTFASHAEWIQPDHSALCASIRECLGGGTPIFRPFTWSGANRHHDRLIAAKSLGALLEDLTADTVNAVFVIGHSHGGSIISMCLRLRPELVDRVEGFVFLSTPFIVAKRRSYGQGLQWFALAVSALIPWTLLIPIFAALALMHSPPAWVISSLGVAVMLWSSFSTAGFTHERKSEISFDRWLRKHIYTLLSSLTVTASGYGSYARLVAANLPTALCVAGGIFVAVVCSAVLVLKLDRYGYLESFVGERLASEACVAKTIEEFSHAKLQDDKAIYVRFTADEAAVGLVALQAVSKLLGYAITLILSICAVFIPRMWKESRCDWSRARVVLWWCISAAMLLPVGAVIGGGALVFLFELFRSILVFAYCSIADCNTPSFGGIFSAISPLASMYNQAVSFMPADPGFFYLYFFLIVVVPVAVVSLLLVVLARPFGSWLAVSAPFVELSIEAAPPGISQIVILSPDEMPADWHPWRPQSLAHSQSYSNPRALHVVAKWIHKKVSNVDQAEPHING